MRHLLLGVALCGFGIPASAEPVSSEHFSRAVKQTHELVQSVLKVDGAPPGIAVIAVRKGEPPSIFVSGVYDVETEDKVNTKTPFYIASMTKAYVGLLAAELDHRGVLSLDTTLADHWPDLVIEGVDTRAVTLRNLLTHRLLFKNEALTFRTAYTDMVPVDDYPVVLSAFSRAKQPGFSYDNLGYLLYAALLEKKTGRSWKEWLSTTLLSPLGLKHTSSSKSSLTGVTAAHQWNGNGWQRLTMKPDSLMHAAGGLATSPEDMARWLMVQLEGKAPGIASRSFDVAQSAVPYPGANKLDRVCNGYAFGWNRCSAYGLSFLEHGGGYTGFRSWMMVAPESGIGFAVLTNSDSVTGWLSEKLMMRFLKDIADTDFENADSSAFSAEYEKLIAKQIEGRLKRDAKERADPKWEGWAWRPEPGDLARYEGRYANAHLGTIDVASNGSGLDLILGEMSLALTPAAKDVFAGAIAPSGPRETIRFVHGASGDAMLIWDDWHFARLK